MAATTKPKIHQFHSGSAVADAVTNSMFFVQSVLQDLGFESHIFVEHLDRGLSGRLRPLADLYPDRHDLLLIHHSMGHDVLPRLAELRCRKCLIYHNITPPRFFSDRDPARAYAIKGYSQLSQLREMVEAAIAISPFNARQLSQREFENVTVIPLLKDFAGIRYAEHAKTPYYDESAVVRLLFVGRINRHKCQHELVELVHKIRSIKGLPLQLVLVGHFDAESAYKAQLDELVRRSGLQTAVRLTGRIGDPELFGWYRAASAYVSLSEHEGFGVPLVEAMAFDLPVIAYASAGVSDTLGEAGITITDKHPDTVLQQVLRLYQDRPFRQKLIRAQRQRVLRFGRTRIQSELRRWLGDLGVHAGNKERPPPILDDDGEQPSKGTHYIVEGPFETSYSLAIVNRNLALSLDERAASASYVEPADGTEDYSVDWTAAGQLPPEIQQLVRPAPFHAERIVTIRNTYPARPNGLLGDLRLIHLAWEESAISDKLSGLINLHLDGVLVPSEYSKRALQNSGVCVPIAVIGHGTDHSGTPPRVVRGRDDRGQVTPALPFTFLHVSSGLARKGIEELITAYCIAFSSHDPVLLVLKTFDNRMNTIDFWVERLTRAGRYSPAIQVISGELDDRQIEFLYHIADAVVLPTRGEGFNLPAAEAMARGVPVIATRHSGQLDFCNDDNSFLIDCTYEISASHLKIPNSYWARASTEQLVQVMKEMYRVGRYSGSSVAARALKGQLQVSDLRWRGVAEKVERFVQHLTQRPVMRKKLRLAWVSTFNARCGIATHSAHLLEFLDNEAFDVTIIADDQEAIGPDPVNVIRLWRKGGVGLSKVVEYLIANQFDAVFIQYNVAFFDPPDLADMIQDLANAGIAIYVVLHRTKGLVNDTAVSHWKTRQALLCCTRVFVHSVDDINRLSQDRITENVVLLPHGVIDRAPLDSATVRGLLGLSGFGPVIGSFGFLLPGKGLIELVHSFALVLRAYPKAYLLMLNSEYPTPESRQERGRCEQVVRELQIDEQVRLVDEFLEMDEALFLLSACDAIVFPYQQSQESASGAVRFGLAAGRPVLTTPLPVFSDLSDVVPQLPGIEARQIAEGLISFLGDGNAAKEVVRLQREWVRCNSWAVQAQRISNIIRASFEEAHGVRICDPIPNCAMPGAERERAQHTAAPSEEAMRAIHKLLAHRSVRQLGGGAQTVKGATNGTHIPAASEADKTEKDSVYGGSRFAGLLRRASSRSDGGRRLLSRADRARDARNWSAAARYYREALDLDGSDPTIWVQYGHALKESGNLADAESAYRASLALNEDLADTHLQLGHVLKIQGRNIEASAAYFRALVLDPALDHAAFELRGLGWTRGRIQFVLRRERSSPHAV